MRRASLLKFPARADGFGRYLRSCCGDLLVVVDGVSLVLTRIWRSVSSLSAGGSILTGT
jgi:hypothetical protein